jgi:hypothetical protein
MLSKQNFFVSRWTAVASLAGILAINSVLVLVLISYITDQILKREGVVTQEFLQGIVTADDNHKKLFDSPGPSPALVAFAKTVERLPGMVRANVYSPDGFIRYSTEKNLVGVKFSENSELAESFAGELIVSFEKPSFDDKEEHLGLAQGFGDKLMEAYMPLRDDKGQMFAVIEFYRKSASLESMINGIAVKMWAAAALSAIALFLALYWVAARLNRG